MLIYNNDEFKNHFRTEDNQIFQIYSSCHNLRDFAEQVRNVMLQRENAQQDWEMNVYQDGNNKNITYLETEEEPDQYLYTHIFDPESEEGLDTQRETRARLFEDFDKFQYNQYHGFRKLEHVPLAELYDAVLEGLDIVPTLRNDMDMPIKKMQELSTLSHTLYFEWMELNQSNPIPSKEDLLFYDSLNAYEKAAFTSNTLNPKFKLDAIRALKAVNGYADTVITQEMMDTLLHSRDIQEFVANYSGYTAPVNEEELTNYQALDAAFQAKFRRAPRVLPEIYKAYQRFHNNRILNEEQIADIVDNFTLTDMQKIAKHHNATALILSNKLNLSETKDMHLQMMESYLIPEQLAKLERKGFYAWYDVHKRDIKMEVLETLLSNVDNITYFDPDITPALLLTQSAQVDGYIHAAGILHEYGEDFDFRNNVVAIPNRGVSVIDTVKGVKVSILAADDARLFTAPMDCQCCQNVAPRRSIMEEVKEHNLSTLNEIIDYIRENYHGEHVSYCSAGGACVLNEITNPCACVTLFEDAKTGKTVAQADSHYDPATDTFIFDNIEFTHANDGALGVGKIHDALAIWAESVSFANIHIGTGYNQAMISIGKPLKRGEFVDYRNENEILNRHNISLYSDYHATGGAGARTIKRNGELLIESKLPFHKFRIDRQPEDNREFAYLTHPVARLFTTYNKEQKIDFIARLETGDLTLDELRTLMKADITLLKDILNIPYEIQKEMVDADLKNVEYIQHIDERIIPDILKETPQVIRKIENASKEMWAEAIKLDGMLIELAPEQYCDEELYTAAIKQNPFAVKYVVKKCEEAEANKYINLAIFRKPIIISHFPNVPEYIWLQALKKDGTLGIYCPKQTKKIQETMINQNPYNISYIREPLREIIMKAAEKLPQLKHDHRYAKNFSDTRDIASELRAQHTQMFTQHIQQTEPIQPISEQEDDYDFDESVFA